MNIVLKEFMCTPTLDTVMTAIIATTNLRCTDIAYTTGIAHTTGLGCITNTAHTTDHARAIKLKREIQEEAEDEL
tara:strand:- start:79 stop:303 length:225 start_codon:yes stop_codon:yes gene_type:complete